MHGCLPLLARPPPSPSASPHPPPVQSPSPPLSLPLYASCPPPVVTAPACLLPLSPFLPPSPRPPPAQSPLSSPSCLSPSPSLSLCHSLPSSGTEGVGVDAERSGRREVGDGSAAGSGGGCRSREGGREKEGEA
ncbi:hypothetical protein MRB53_020112 [Persea americana]|uniref:Uncharacterized protein n=1 Tax=Persea americana TaxID=3435 RepID=A0ACC2L035_PERAE|nr:hypothetical protein MRB53_020112 [Persea americana]